MARKPKETNTPTHIIENFYMDADSNQYILVEKVSRTNKKTNKRYEGITTHGYYTTIESLLNAVIDLSVRNKIKSNQVPTIKEAIEDIKNTKIKLMGLYF